VNQDLRQRLQDIDLALRNGLIDKKKATHAKKILLSAYSDIKATSATKISAHSGSYSGSQRARDMNAGLGSNLGNSSTRSFWFDESEQDLFSSLDTETIQRLKAISSSKSSGKLSEQAYEQVRNNIFRKKYSGNEDLLGGVASMIEKEADESLEATIPPPKPLSLESVAMYVMSSVSLVQDRVVAGQLSAWALPFAEKHRLFIVIEDGADVRRWLRDDMNCNRVELSSQIKMQDDFNLRPNETSRLSLNYQVLHGSSLCKSYHGMVVLLTGCLSTRWGTHGPCCKAEAALLHHQTHFQRENIASSSPLSPPKWVVLAEDDHVFHVQGLLQTLAYFNASIPMTLGHSGKMQRFPLGRVAQPNVHKRVEKCFKGAGEGIFDMLPFRNPSIFTIPALQKMGEGLAVGSLRRQCNATGLTHDVVVGLLTWMHKIPHLPHWGHCVLRAPFSSFSHSSAVQSCVLSAISNLSKGGAAQKNDDSCLMPSQIALHDCKKASEQHAAAAYLRLYPPRRRGIEACMRRGVNTSQFDDERVNYMRLLHIDGYARTKHSLHPLIDPLTGQWRTFEILDCQKGSVLDPLTAAAFDPNGRIIGKSGRWLGSIAMIDRFVDGKRETVQTFSPTGELELVEVFDKLRKDLLLH
jgi:hypothetical protein